MKIFNKKRKEDLECLGDDRSVSIEPYAPHQNLGPLPYTVPVAIRDLDSCFPSKVSEFLSNTNPDQYNATFADNLIEHARNQALVDLDKQRIDHIRTIERSISSLWKGDEFNYKQKLADAEEEYQQVEKRLEKLTQIYQKGTALEEPTEMEG